MPFRRAFLSLDDEGSLSWRPDCASESEKRSRAGDHLAALGHAEAGLALCDGGADWDAGDGHPLSALRAGRVPAYRSLLRARALARLYLRRAKP